LRTTVLALLLVSALVVAGCGSHSNSSIAAGTASTTHFAKTKFVLHAGLAFGAFHRWIYKPFKAGVLSHPFLHKLAFVKALAAAAFVLHEVRLARADAAQSRFLSHVLLPLTAVGSAVALIHAGLRHQQPNSQAINAAESSVAATHSASSAAGQPITETTAGAPI
jgi:hypothetical protein